jgi:hypothetical protein
MISNQNIVIFKSPSIYYIYIYILYIFGAPGFQNNQRSLSPMLPPVQPYQVPSVYKRSPRALGFHFVAAPAVTPPPRCTSDGAPPCRCVHGGGSLREHDDGHPRWERRRRPLVGASGNDRSHRRAGRRWLPEAAPQQRPPEAPVMAAHPRRVQRWWPPDTPTTADLGSAHAAVDPRGARGVGSPKTRMTATTCSSHCLCMALLVGHILGRFSSIMMRRVDIYATFYESLCFCTIPDIHFCVYIVGTKITFKICMHAMKTPTTYHNFRMCIKVEIKCMHPMVAIFFESAIKIRSHACVWRVYLRMHVSSEGTLYNRAHIFMLFCIHI